MPINIYRYEDKKQIDYLCCELWESPQQIEELEKWITIKKDSMDKGDYVADIGYTVR